MKIHYILSFLLILVFSTSYAQATITCPSTVTCTDAHLQNCTYSKDSHYNNWVPYAQLNLQPGTYLFNSAYFADSVTTRANGQMNKPECLYCIQGSSCSSNLGLNGDTDLLAQSTSDSVAGLWKLDSTGVYKCLQGSQNLPPADCPFMLSSSTTTKK